MAKRIFPITRAQRVAIKNIMERDHAGILQTLKRGKIAVLHPYQRYRRMAMPTFGCGGAIIFPIWGMWLCIERDGYTHNSLSAEDKRTVDEFNDNS